MAPARGKRRHPAAPRGGVVSILSTMNDRVYHGAIASRFAIDASGNAPSIDVLKQAVAAIDTGKLAGLAK